MDILLISNFQQLKENSGLTFRELQIKTGAGLGTLQKIRDGMNVEVDTLARVSIALGCSLSDLYDISEEK